MGDRDDGVYGGAWPAYICVTRYSGDRNIENTDSDREAETPICYFVVN